MTTIELSSQELESLRKVLVSSLSQLYDEIAHTDHREFRAGLKQERLRITAILDRVRASQGG